MLVSIVIHQDAVICLPAAKEVQEIHPDDHRRQEKLSCGGHEKQEGGENRHHDPHDGGHGSNCHGESHEEGQDEVLNVQEVPSVTQQRTNAV